MVVVVAVVINTGTATASNNTFASLCTSEAHIPGVGVYVGCTAIDGGGM